MICRSDRCACGRRECPTPDACDDSIYTPEDAQGLAIAVWCALALLGVLAALPY